MMLQILLKLKVLLLNVAAMIPLSGLRIRDASVVRVTIDMFGCLD